MTGEPYDTDRVLTIPNALSVIRLLGVPLFLWLLIGVEADIWALIVLVTSGLTDWFDGWIARRFRQRSKLGQVLDPAADRLYIWATLIGFLIRGIIPWWLAALLFARDIMMALTIWPALRRRGFASLPVHFLGKLATFVLLYAFPLILLGFGDEPWQFGFRVFGWASTIWGIIMYWYAGLLYMKQGFDVIRQFPVPTREAAQQLEEPRRDES